MAIGILTRSRSHLLRQRESESTNPSPSASFETDDVLDSLVDVFSPHDVSSTNNNVFDLDDSANQPSTSASRHLRPRNNPSTASSSSSTLHSKDASTSTSPPRKRKCGVKATKTESISDVIDRPCEDMTDRQKMNVISDYLTKHSCIFDKTLALSSLHKLHSRICR